MELKKNKSIELGVWCSTAISIKHYVRVISQFKKFKQAKHSVLSLPQQHNYEVMCRQELRNKCYHLPVQEEDRAGNRGALSDSCANYADGCCEVAGIRKPLDQDPWQPPAQGGHSAPGLGAGTSPCSVHPAITRGVPPSQLSGSPVKEITMKKSHCMWLPWRSGSKSH